MSGFEAAVVAAVEWFASLSATTYFQIAVAVYTAYNVYDASKKAQEARNAARDSLKDRLVTVQNSSAERTIVYGRTRVAGACIPYRCQHGTRREKLTFVVPLAGHEVTAIDEVWFNDENLGDFDGSFSSSGGGGNLLPGSKFHRPDARNRITQRPHPGMGEPLTFAVPGETPTGPVYVGYEYWQDTSYNEGSPGANVIQVLREGVDYTYNPGDRYIVLTSMYGYGSTVSVNWSQDYGSSLVRVGKFLGTTVGERNFELEDASNGEWTLNARMRGVAHVAVTMTWDQAVFGPVGIPNITAVIRGKKVKNWITGVTEYSENPAYIVADYLTSQMGFAIPEDKIDVTSVQAAAIACDELIPIDGSGGTQKRYTCNGVLSTGSDRRENLKLLVGAMAGAAIYSAGKWYIRAGVYHDPVFTIEDEDHAGGPIKFAPATPKRELFNSVRGLFSNPQELYQTTDFPPYESSTYIAKDGGYQTFLDIALPMTDDPIRSQRIAKLMLHQSRLSFTFTTNFKISTFPLQAGDTVYIKWSRYGWKSLNGGLGKIFRVVRKKFSANGEVEMTLKEESPLVYDWAYNEATIIDPAPNTALPNPSRVDPLKNVSFFANADTYERASDGTITPYVVLTADPITDSAVLQGGWVDVDWRRIVDPVWQRVNPALIADQSVMVKLKPVSPGETIIVQTRVYNGAQAESSLTTNVYNIPTTVPGAQYRSVGNLVQNSTFVTGVLRWRTHRSAEFTGYVFQKEVSSVLKGSPSNAILYLGEANPIGAPAYQIAAETEFFPVTVGQRYSAYVFMIPVRCTGSISICFYRADGVAIENQALATIDDMNGKNPSVQSDYVFCGGFRKAPIGASYAALRINHHGHTAGNINSGIFITRPFTGAIPDFQIDHPLWNAGLAGTVNADWIEDESTTKMWKSTFSPVVWTPDYLPPIDPDPKNPNPALQETIPIYGGSRRVCFLDFTPKTSGPAEVTMEVTATYRSPLAPQATFHRALLVFNFGDGGAAGATPVTVEKDIVRDKSIPGTGLPNDPGLFLDYNTAGIPRGSRRTVSASRQMWLTAGQRYTMSILVDNDGATVPILVYNANTIDYANLRVVQLLK